MGIQVLVVAPPRAGPPLIAIVVGTHGRATNSISAASVLLPEPTKSRCSAGSEGDGDGDGYRGSTAGAAAGDAAVPRSASMSRPSPSLISKTPEQGAPVPVLRRHVGAVAVIDDQQQHLSAGTNWQSQTCAHASSCPPHLISRGRQKAPSDKSTSMLASGISIVDVRKRTAESRWRGMPCRKLGIRISRNWTRPPIWLND